MVIGLIRVLSDIKDSHFGSDEFINVLIGDLIPHGDTALVGILGQFLDQLARKDPVYIFAYLLDVLSVLVQDGPIHHGNELVGDHMALCLQREAVDSRLLGQVFLLIRLGVLLADIPLAGTLVMPLHAALPDNLDLGLDELALPIPLRAQPMGAPIDDLIADVMVVGLNVGHGRMHVLVPVTQALLVPITLAAGARIAATFRYYLLFQGQVFGAGLVVVSVLFLYAQHNIGFLKLFRFLFESLEVRHVPAIPTTAFPFPFRLLVTVFLYTLLAGLMPIVDPMNNIDPAVFDLPIGLELAHIVIASASGIPALGPTLAMTSAFAAPLLITGLLGACKGEQLVGGQHLRDFSVLLLIMFVGMHLHGDIIGSLLATAPPVLPVLDFQLLHAVAIVSAAAGLVHVCQQYQAVILNKYIHHAHKFIIRLQGHQLKQDLWT